MGHPTPGADDDRYYLMASRALRPEDATGSPADLEPVKKWLDAQGWGSEVEGISGDQHLWGDSGDGWVVEYAVRQNGQYSRTVFSELFWTNDYSALLGAISQRDPADYPESSRPGDFQPFPRWSDPAVS